MSPASFTSPQEAPMAPPQGNGLIHLSSPYHVPETLERVQSAVQSHGLTIFCLVDHSGEAAKVGMEMHPTELLIFGNPKGGTPLMLASPTVAIDFPLKALVWEDADGKVWLTYNSPDYLQQRHNLPDNLMKNISGVGALLQAAIQ
jgi:uncharacterized protein (DUF302 family)